MATLRGGLLSALRRKGDPTPRFYGNWAGPPSSGVCESVKIYFRPSSCCLLTKRSFLGPKPSRMSSERFRGGIHRLHWNGESKTRFQESVKAADREGSITPSPHGSGDENDKMESDWGKWGSLVGWLFFFGMGLGPPLDGIHSVVELQTYDNGAFLIGDEPYGLHTNIWVFPLLGAMYSVVGSLQLILDRFFLPNQVPQGSWTRVLTSICILIGLLRLSAQLYEDGMDYTWIFIILSICAHGNWYALDRTAHGYFLALLLAFGAPVSEAFIIKFFGLWHYSQPDIFIADEGLVSWTCWCYFFYTQFVSSLAHCLQTYIFNPPKERFE